MSSSTGFVTSLPVSRIRFGKYGSASSDSTSCRRGRSICSAALPRQRKVSSADDIRIETARKGTVGVGRVREPSISEEFSLKIAGPSRTRRALDTSRRFQTWSALERGVRDFIEERVNDLDSKHAATILRFMPRQADFLESGRSDLLYGIYLHGGLIEVARRMKLLPNYHASRNYKDDFPGLAAEIRVFDRALHAKCLFPTGSSMRYHGRLDLLAGIRAHGGVSEVARRMGLKIQWGNLSLKHRRSEPHWLKKELASVRPASMPTHSELIDSGRLDLLRAVKDLGGREVVAETLGLKLEDRMLLNEDILFQEICESKTALEYNEGNELQRKPTDRAPTRGGGGGALLGREGGRRREAYHYRNFDRVKNELMCFIFDDGAMGVMPTRSELLRAGRGDLVRAMALHGGQKAVAKRLNLIRYSEGKQKAKLQATSKVGA